MPRTDIPRRIILSRKGFDSKYGGCPSVILPDETLLSLPIPDRRSGVRYGELRVPGTQLNLGTFTNHLRGCKVRSDSQVHLDPDLRRGMHPAHLGSRWRPLFGQTDAAETHLSNHEVGRDGGNDLFLFFGWFRRAVLEPTPSFVRGAGHEHVLWGWLQVECVIDAKDNPPDYARHHPHCIGGYGTVYVGRETLTFAPGTAGGGVFPKYHSDLRLTRAAEHRRRRMWRLPAFFSDGLTYHRTDEWERHGGHVNLASACIGQEFIFHTTPRTEQAVAQWLQTLFAHAPRLAKGAAVG